jgi:predicted XRE-type DNA-binding protein
MKKKHSTFTDTDIEVLLLVEKLGKQGKISEALPLNPTFEQKMKYSLCKLFVRYIRVNKITPTELSKKLEIPKTRMSNITTYKIEKYTVDRLLGYAWKLAELDPQTREHLHLMFEVLSGPVRTVKESKKIEKELLRYA